MKNRIKNAFTLIELLAVIIILGILMIIAIPSVTSYISNSRKNAYIDTARQVISSTRNLVNSGKLGMYDTSATYYVPTSCIKTENGGEATSPFGKFERAYVIVTYEGTGYNYYWVSVDETGQGIKTVTKADDLDVDLIENNLKGTDIELITVTGKSKIIEFNSNCTSTTTHALADGNIASTVDNITWTYQDMSISVDLHLSSCNVLGDYKICYNATIEASNIGTDNTIKSFEASFDVPDGTVVVAGGYTPGKLKAVLEGNTLKIIGNEGQDTWNYLTPDDEGNYMTESFQIKFPKDVEFVLQNGRIKYVELVSDIQEGQANGNSSDMNQDLAALNVRLIRETYYGDGNGGYVEQYTVQVKNISENDITDWSFILEVPDDITNVFSYDPLLYTKNGNVYTFYPSQWNEYRTITSGDTAEYERKLVIETKNTNAIPIIR